MKTKCSKSVFFFLTIVLFCLLSNVNFAQSGNLDLTFNASDFGTGSGGGAKYTTLVQPDGKILVGGNFDFYKGNAVSYLMRIKADGALDSSFNFGAIGPNASVHCGLIEPDGKILIGGNFTSYNGIPVNRIARINLDGSLDTSFNYGGLGADSTILQIKKLSSGKYLVSGCFRSYNGSASGSIVRINTDGSRDAGFTSLTPSSDFTVYIKNVAELSDHKLMISGFSYNISASSYYFFLLRMYENGGNDIGFNAAGSAPEYFVHALHIQQDGKLLIGGSFSTFNGVPKNKIARLHPDGSLDTTFTTTVNTGNVYSIYSETDSAIYIAGDFNQVNGITKRNIARLFYNGTLDSSFHPTDATSNGVISFISKQADEKLIVSGDFSYLQGTSLLNRLARINLSGKIDSSFVSYENKSGADNDVRVSCLQTDGKLLIGGDFQSFNGYLVKCLVRLNSNGEMDTSFHIGTGLNFAVYAIAVQSDGKILVGGNFTTLNGTSVPRLVRLFENGSVDTTFNNGGSGPSGIVYSIKVSALNKILIGGAFVRYNGELVNRMVMLKNDGTRDSSFNMGSGFNLVVRDIEIFGDTAIYACGDFYSYKGKTCGRLVKIFSDGDLDSNFVVSTNNSIYSMCFQLDGKIIIGGNFTTCNSDTVNRITRLKINGVRDSTFNMGGTGAMDPEVGLSWIYHVLLQSDGKVMIGGTFKTVNGISREYLARLKSDGRLDSSFNAGQSGPNALVHHILQQTDGRLIVSGDFTRYNNTGKNRLVRINADVCHETIVSEWDSACSSSLPYLWKGITITASGTYTKNYTTSLGCDSIHYLNLTVFSEIITSPTLVTQELVDNTCGARVYRVTASDVTNADGYEWILPSTIGGVGSVLLDSGDISKSRIIKIQVSSSNASLVTDSIKVRATNYCSTSSYKGIRFQQGALFPPAAPTTFTITPVQTNVCNERIYRYSYAYILPPSTSSTVEASNYLWSWTGVLGSSAVLDSGTVNSRVIRLKFSSNEAAGILDSIKLQFESACGNSQAKAIKLTNTLLSPPAKPSSITIQSVATSICGSRTYRYIAPTLLAATTTTGAATGWNWSFKGSLYEFATIDSGDVNSQKILITFASNSAASAGDSVLLQYTSACGNTANRALKLPNTLLRAPSAPASITMQSVVTNICGERKFRFIAPNLPSASTTSGAANGFVWNWKGSLFASATLDSGTINSQKIVIRITSNSATAIGDSMQLYFTSGCGNSSIKSVKPLITKLSTPLAPASISITPISTNICGLRKYRYTAPALPTHTSTNAAATGYTWSWKGALSSSISIDSGSVNAGKIVLIFSSNAAASAGDSIVLNYSSTCGNSLSKAMKFSNLVLNPPSAPTSITQTLVENTCYSRVYRYSTSALPAATTSTGTANGWLWSMPSGYLGAFATLDSGSLTDQKIKIKYTNNSAAIAGDSIKVRFSSGCGYSTYRTVKLSNIMLTGCVPVTKISNRNNSSSNTFDSNEKLNEIKAYPNPSKTDFTIDIGHLVLGNTWIIVQNQEGRIIEKVKPNKNGIMLMGNLWVSGIYFLSVKNEKFEKTIKLVKIQ